MCLQCGKPVEHHLLSDPFGKPEPSKGTITLKATTCLDHLRYKLVEMPGATSGRYAAMRVAKELGVYDEDYEYGLLDADMSFEIPMDVPIAAWDGNITGQNIT